MFDFNDHYTLNELLAIDNIMCFVRATAAEPIDIARLRRDLNRLHRSLSRAINAKLDEAAIEWDREHAVTENIEKELERQLQQAEQAAQAKQAPAAADPPAPPDMFGWVGDALDDLCAAGEVLGADE